MKHQPQLAAALTGLGLLTSCAQPRLVGGQCPLDPLPVEVAAVQRPPGGIEAAESSPPRTYAAALAAALAPRTGGIEDGARDENLVLSGGGKWGAFGAGFLTAWPNRPQFRTVTGVSTGALQSTFVFLGNQPVAAARAYPAALELALPANAPQPGRGRRYIDDLNLAYTFTTAATVLDVLGDETTALRKGSAASLAPLRRRLDAMIDPDTIAAVAAAGQSVNGQSGRALFVGVVDMDDGLAYAIDMTALAQKAVADSANAERYRQCYIDVLLAASSEPMIAFPVFIGGRKQSFDTRMYMDAGLRNGVFLQEVLKADGSPAKAVPASFNTTVIVNGALELADLTQKPDAKWAREWSLLSLVLRTKDMLVNQIYEFSVRRVRDFGAARGDVRVRTARGYRAHVFQGKTCQALQDEADGKPFPPAFMQCLIDYGRNRGAALAWEDAATASAGR